MQIFPKLDPGIDRISDPSHLYWALSGAVFLALYLSLLFQSGFYAAVDDAQYMVGVYKAVTGIPERLPDDVLLAALRLGMVLPLAALYSFSGMDLNVVTYGMTLWHPALVFVTFCLARQVHGDKSAVWAAYILAASPLCYIYAGSILPDIALAFWVVVSVLVLFRAIRSYQSSDSIDARDLLLLGLSGFFLGVAYSVKISALVMALPAGLIILGSSRAWLSPKTIYRGAAFGLGLLAFLALEALVMNLIYGQYYSRFGVVAGFTDYYVTRASLPTAGIFPTQRLAYAARELIQTIPITLPFLIAGVAAYIWFSKRASWAILLLALWSIFYLIFGSTSLTTYAPPTIQSRYFVLALPFIAIISGSVASATSYKIIHSNIPTKLAEGFGQRIPLILAAIVVVELVIQLPAANKLYDAEWRRLFEKAYAEAQEYDMPIVVSPMLTKYQAPVVFPALGTRVHLAKDYYALDPKPLPDPPFLLIETGSVMRNLFGSGDACWLSDQYGHETWEFLHKASATHAKSGTVTLRLLSAFIPAQQPGGCHEWRATTVLAKITAMNNSKTSANLGPVDVSMGNDISKVHGLAKIWIAIGGEEYSSKAHKFTPISELSDPRELALTAR